MGITEWLCIKLGCYKEAEKVCDEIEKEKDDEIANLHKRIAFLEEELRGLDDENGFLSERLEHIHLGDEVSIKMLRGESKGI